MIYGIMHVPPMTLFFMILWGSVLSLWEILWRG